MSNQEMAQIEEIEEMETQENKADCLKINFSFPVIVDFKNSARDDYREMYSLFSWV